MRSGAQPPIGSTWPLGSVSEPRPPVGCSPRVRPFPPRPPPEVAFLCSVLPRYTTSSDFSPAYMLGVWLLPSRAGPAQVPGTGETSQVPRKELPHVHKVSDCARFFHASQYAMEDVAFSSAVRDRHLGIRPVSQLNTWPVVSPVNASRLPSRAEPRASLGVGVVG